MKSTESVVRCGKGNLTLLSIWKHGRAICECRERERGKVAEIRAEITWISNEPDCLGFGGSLGVSPGGIGNLGELLNNKLESVNFLVFQTNLCFFPTAPGEFFASKLEFNDFGVVAADEASLLCARAEFLLSIIVLVSIVVSCIDSSRCRIHATKN